MELNVSQINVEFTYQNGDKFNSNMWFFGTFSHKIILKKEIGLD